MGAFERMWSRLPDVLKSEDIKKLYMASGEIFDLLEVEQQPYIYTEVLSELKGDMLDKYGMSYGVHRGNLIDEGYVNKIKIERAKSDFIPTLNNFIDIIKFVTGYRVEAYEGWLLNPPEKALMKLKITIPAGSNRDLLLDLDSLYSCGDKTIWEVRQESYIPLELIGEHNKTGIKNINKEYIRVLDETQRSWKWLKLQILKI